MRNGLVTTTWSRFWSCWSLFSLACCTQFISSVIWNLRFPFFWSCVCHYKRFTTLGTKPVNMFLDARPFDYVFLFRRLTRLKEGPTLQYLCRRVCIFKWKAQNYGYSIRVVRVVYDFSTPLLKDDVKWWLRFLILHPWFWIYPGRVALDDEWHGHSRSLFIFLCTRN